MRRSHAHTERGFTLAEILVTTAIFAVIMIAALTVYDRSNKVFKSGTEAADLQQSTRIAFDKLTSDVRMAGFDYNRGGTPNGAVGAAIWSPATAYAAGVQVDPGNGMIYTCSTPGTSGASPPTWNLTVNAITNDNTVKWTTVLVNQFAQMDEQVEYAGKSAVVFRSNFDYNTDSTHGNGLEDAEGYTPIDATSGTKIFPYVTTGNDEIVAFALRSADTSKNTGAISFYLDAAKPRAAYPGGSAEAKVVIGQGQGITGQGVTAASCNNCGIDLTNVNPPYTLYRITVDDVIKGSMGTPVAENIRSMNFYYYSDAAASTLLKEADTTTDIATTRDAGTATTDAHDQNGALTGAVGGDGQYDPANTATPNYVDRSLRAQVQSIRVQMIGLNTSPDPKYANPTETLPAFKNYREYALQAVIVPRNFGLTGYPEPTNDRPGPPTITGSCTGYCAAPVIAWQGPQSGSAVLKYLISWDTNPQGCFCPPRQIQILDPTQTQAIIPDNGTIDPTQTLYIQMQAVNDNGTSTASNTWSLLPKNSTKPSPPTSLTASTATQTHAQNAANTDYAVTLGWTAPSTNDNSKATTTCTGTGCTASGSVIPSQEMVKFRVWRGTTAAFDPNAGEGVQILGYSDASQPPAVTPGAAAFWQDSPATSAYAPGTCVQYYYRVQAVDRCSTNAAYNVSGSANDAISTLAPAAPSAAIAGKAYDAGVQALAPTVFNVDTANSACVANSNCTIVLNWQRPTQDTAGNNIGIDRYQLTRYRKEIIDPSFTLDPTFGSGGSMQLNGYSQLSGASVSYKDTTAPATAPDGSSWYYQYIVAANDCRLGQPSAPVEYPVSCSFAAIFSSSGAGGGAGTSANPYIMTSGDTVQLVSGTGITSIQYYITLNGAAVTNSNLLTSAPYSYAWPDLTYNTEYQLTAVVKSATCTERYVMYVTDHTPTVCAFSNGTEVAPSLSQPGGNPNPKLASETYTITNSGQAGMTLSGNQIKIEWQYVSGTYSDMTMTGIDWGCFNDTFATGAGAGTVTRTIPSCVNSAGVLATNQSKTFKINWKYAHNDSTLSTTTGLKKICIEYSITGEPGTKHCNLVGQAASNTQNPTGCD